MLFFRKISSYLVQPGSTIGVGIFRILFGLVLQAEILQFLYFYDFIYGTAPGANWEIDNSIQLVFVGWWFILVLLTIGVWVRPAAILNYILSVVFFGSLRNFEYHVDYYFLGMNFLLMFLPKRTAFSLSWRPFGLKRPDDPVHGVTWGYVLLTGMIGIVFVYGDSVLTKIESPMWRAGLGFYTPASLPMVSWSNLDWILDREWLVKLMGWSVFIFEAALVLLLPIRSLRGPLAVFGFCFHVGICIAFPIPWFGLGVAAYYLLLLPDSWWQTIFKYLGLGGWLPEGLVDQDRALRRLPWGIAFFIIALTTQVILSLMHPVVQRCLPERFNLAMDTVRSYVHPWSRQLLGMTRHGVFMDGHFAGYNHEIAVVRLKNGKEKWLPLIEKDGRPGSYLLGR
ncbi:MAG: HTTM domain-containing protein, partial [Acidimicrobiales bacterium]|nr:HTTM domain-containing protein [Acidimicrobiales bacterium]